MYKSRRRRRWLLLAAIALLPVGYFYLLSFMAARPTHLGVTNGRLAPCPASPNCVSSQADDAAHHIEPLTIHGPVSTVLLRLKIALSREPRMKIVTESENYLHVEATSLLFRFVDDVEFYVDTEAHVIHCRSASRVGYSDLGANRARMERIRAAWNQEK